ncbi:hypothetical protein Sbal223_0264 [Shewanella baltica OS223]|nr:hypothetical protein Sbal223_0264 [Shewanella baltica OS223]
MSVPELQLIQPSPVSSFPFPASLYAFHVTTPHNKHHDF